VAVLLNVTPDHLDRYDSFEAYRASKMRLFEMQSADHLAVGPDDRVSPSDPFDVWGPFGPDGRTIRDAQPLGAQADWPSLQGPHNAQNALTAINVTLALGVPEEQIAKALRTFTGLPHRMERVATHNGVLFVNDSKATNTDSSAPALAAYPPEGNGPRIHWIVGGLPKEDGLGATEAHLSNVKAAYTIGEAGPRFAELLTGRVPRVVRAEMMCEAVRAAMAAAVPGDVVLLSPACASFDQFKDYEQRGERFRQFVEALTADDYVEENCCTVPAE
jgi:UDP-N-acetylmuramoylalanine--D-glutamate ligase